MIIVLLSNNYNKVENYEIEIDKNFNLNRSLTFDGFKNIIMNTIGIDIEKL